MALAIDAVSSTSGNGAGPFSWSHTCSGSDRVLFVGISHYDSNDTVSGVTYNSVAMTAVPSGATNNGQFYVSLWYLIAPATGSNTVSVSMTGSVFDIGMAAISFTGSHQTTPYGTAVTATGSSTTPSVVASSASDEIVLDTLTIVHSGTLSVGADQTSRWNTNTANAFIKMAGSTEPGVASTTMSWSNSTSQDWAIVAVPVKPTATGVTLRQLCLTGVGT